MRPLQIGFGLSEATDRHNRKKNQKAARGYTQRQLFTENQGCPEHRIEYPGCGNQRSGSRGNIFIAIGNADLPDNTDQTLKPTISSH